MITHIQYLLPIESGLKSLVSPFSFSKTAIRRKNREFKIIVEE